VKEPQSIVQGYRIIAKSGDVRWIEDRKTSVFNREGLFIGIDGIVLDVTERRKTALALEYRREFERLITDISRRFINLSSEKVDKGINQALKALGEFAKVDRSYIFQLFDEGRKTSNTHEWCAEGITPQIDNLQDISVDMVPWWMDKLARFENIYIPDVEKLPARAKNEKKILQVQSIRSLIVIPLVCNRRLIGFVGFDSVRRQRTWSEESIAMLTIVSEIFTNTLTRRRIQQELDLYQEKMHRAEQLASLGMVSATIAHELNQPLTVIKLFLQQGLRALKEDNDVDRVAEVIDDCLNEVTKAASTVDRFRRFARKAAPIYVTEVDLVEVAERVVGLLTEGARRKKLDLSFNAESRPPHIIGNSVELEQMFFVLIQNAIQAADGQIERDMTITISTQAGHIQLTFADTCGGIKRENIDKIFEPFFTTKPPNVSTGLGLCILERIVKRHGGSVRVESQEGHGTIFYIGLPTKN
jgi:signal transduction histidine kinase